MIPVEEGNTRCGLTWICLGHANAYAVGRFQPLFSCGAVGIAGVHDQRLDLPLSTAQMLASNRDRRSDDLVSREHGGGGSAVGSQGQC